MPTSCLPDALLLDFGGVVVQTAKLPDGRDAVVTHLAGILERAGWAADRAELRASLDAGLTALKLWKNASSRRREPRELTHREIVGEYLVPDLAAGPRSALLAQAQDITAAMNTAISRHDVRPGIRATLELCGRHGIPVGIVSNAHSGRSHRAILAEAGLGEHFGVQVYSDEVGIRKPHPRMLTLAAEALGVDVARCWYVGDTMDRDVAAGRRAGVGAVVVTRTGHTDNPPFPVPYEPDHVFDTPEGLLDLLRAAGSRADLPGTTASMGRGGGPAPSSGPASAPRTGVAGPGAARTSRRGGRPVLLVDHGGVIAEAGRTHAVLTASADELVALAGRAGHELAHADALAALEHGKSAHRARKTGRTAAGDHREVTPEEFWGDLVGAALPPAVRALARIESADLMHRYYLTKADHRLRPGVRPMLEHCASAGIDVVVVSNTVSGRGVRSRLAAAGVDHLVAAGVYSDEVGYRKPDPRIFAEALAIADADPASTWFLGDKPVNDAAGAQGVGIAHRVLVRGGSAADAELDVALADGRATAVVDTPADLVPLLTAAHPGAVAPTTNHSPVTPRPEGARP